MKFETMDTPSTREEFEHRFYLLLEKRKEGKLHYPPGVELGLDKVKILPNGRIDFQSVNESARLQVNSTFNFNESRLQGLFDMEENQKNQDDNS